MRSPMKKVLQGDACLPLIVAVMIPVTAETEFISVVSRMRLTLRAFARRLLSGCCLNNVRRERNCVYVGVALVRAIIIQDK